jgi:hypothetical protein
MKTRKKPPFRHKKNEEWECKFCYFKCYLCGDEDRRKPEPQEFVRPCRTCGIQTVGLFTYEKVIAKQSDEELLYHVF